MPETAAPSAPPAAWRALLAVAAGKLAIHLPLAGAYGFHRDEWYYLACGRRLAWGYVDHPPVAPLVARLVEEIAGPSLAALRTVPAVLGAVLAVLAGLMAREMGGRAWAQGLAATAVVASPVFLLTHHLYQTVVFDQLAWAAATLAVLRLARTGNQRLWLAVGAVAGVGLLAKHTVALFGIGLVAGMAATPLRRQLRSPWLWAGGALALLVASPNLLWQAAHGWPSLEFARNNNARVAEELGAAASLGIQAAFMGPLVLVLFAAGVAYLFSPRGRPVRWVGVLWLAVTALMLAAGGKPYYPAPSWPAVLAAGAVAAEARAAARGWRRLRVAVPAAVALASLPLAWVALPVVPRAVFARHQEAWPHDEFREEIGWEDLARQVAAAVAALPPDERARAALLTDSYGEAAALEALGPRFGLPPVTSGHNNYFLWGPPETDVVVAVAWERGRLDRAFAEVVEVGRVTNRWGIANESSFQAIYVCRRPRAPWSELWPALGFYV